MLKLLKNLKPYKRSVFFIVCLLFVQALADLYLPNLMAKIIDNGVATGNISYISKMGVWMLGVALIGIVASITATLLSSKTALGFSKDLRRKIFVKVEDFSLDEMGDFGTASLITRTTNDITQVQQLVIALLRMMVTAPIMIVGALIMALSTDVGLSTVILVIIPVLLVVIALILKFALPLFKISQKKLDTINLVLREKLTGLRVIRVFNKIGYERERFDNINKQVRDIAIKSNRIISLLMPALQLILNLSIIALVWFGGIRINDGSLQVGDLVAFIQYLTQIMFSLIMLSLMFVMIPRASASAERINEVLDKEFSIIEKEDGVTETNLVGHVKFDNVSFRYKGAEEPTIKGVSFYAKPGETTAIIGGTGSGKSALLNLIPRFFDAEEGSILIDGVNIKDIKIDTLRSKIGYVPQKAVLFSGTILSNIKYGNENATMEEVEEALDIAQASEFIKNMKDGVNSHISQGGTNVSGGQKQRLCIARAIAKKPEIYLFDDSFSALDFKTDSTLRARLKKETTNATTIIVAQRVSTVMDADRIIVLEQGSVVGIGKHRELLECCDVYKEIVSSQLSKEEQ